MSRKITALALVVAVLRSVSVQAKPDEMPWVAVSEDKKGFVLDPSGRPFVPWGFNYDHDDQGRLLEDYWEKEWDKVEAHFAQMKKLGANVVRIHLQVGRFMDAADKPNESSLGRLTKLVGLAEKVGIRLDLTGLGCYHKKDVPAWYDKLSEKDRWDVQARFWEAIAGRCAKSPAIFCYDLMNEPVVPGGKRKDGDWLGPAACRRPPVAKATRRRYPQARQAASDNGGPGGLEPGPARANLRVRAGEDRGRTGLPKRPSVPRKRQGR
jgi:aryl-phospho-beta-D-glucosidase BglC (GH1 family)